MTKGETKYLGPDNFGADVEVANSLESDRQLLFRPLSLLSLESDKQERLYEVEEFTDAFSRLVVSTSVLNERPKILGNPLIYLGNSGVDHGLCARGDVKVQGRILVCRFRLVRIPDTLGSHRCASFLLNLEKHALEKNPLLNKANILVAAWRL
jgi:hypothetical protein